MDTLDRRRFLRLAGGTAALASLPASIRRALAIPANNVSGSIQDVQHVVVLMQENRAFDHYFGTLPGVRGFGDRFTIPLPGQLSVWQQTFNASGSSRTVLPYHLDQSQGNAQRVAGTPHTWPDAHAAWDNGRMSQWPTYKEVQSMGYYEQRELPFQFALANAFTLCDAYHCAMHGGTNPNRLFHWTGTNDPSGLYGGPAIDNQWDSLGPSREGYGWTTYPERLEAAGIRWKIYQNLPNNFTDNPLAGFKQYRQANEKHGNTAIGFPFPPYQPGDDLGNALYKGIANTLPQGHVSNPDLLADFRADVGRGLLPQVSWIIAPDTYSEHPSPSSPVQGAWYVQQVLDALTADPAVWSKTVLLVNFDENDGFFDHLPPPSAPSLNPDGSRAGKSTIDLRGETYTDGLVYGPGPRVPMIVVSPWSRGGWVCSETFSHTSVLRFLEARFGVSEDNLSPWRKAIAGDLTSAFNFIDPNHERLPRLPKLSKRYVDALRLAQELKAPMPVPGESTQQLPKQPAGVRYARPLPYELNLNARLDASSNQLSVQFINTGRVAAVFHVYDRLNLDLIPRRYGVEAGKTLSDTWDLSANGGRYDLWILGPNGWHRQLTGDIATILAGVDAEIAVSYDVTGQSIQMQLRNAGSLPCRFMLSSKAYFDEAPQTIDVAAGQTMSWRHALTDSANWYDFSVTLNEDDSFVRRIAGHMETGLPSVSDPAMGTL